MKTLDIFCNVRCLENSCPLGWPYVLIVFCLFFYLLIFNVGFESWIWLLIAQVTVIYVSIFIIVCSNAETSYISNLYLETREINLSRTLNGLLEGAV